MLALVRLKDLDLKPTDRVVINLSGRGDKDMNTYMEELDLLKELNKILNDIQKFTDSNITSPINTFSEEKIKKPIKESLKINI